MSEIQLKVCRFSVSEAAFLSEQCDGNAVFA